MGSPNLAHVAPKRSAVTHWVLQDIFYIAMLVLALVGVAFRLSVSYWVILIPVLGLITIAEGWSFFSDTTEQLGLVFCVALNWCALLLAIYLLANDGVRGVMNANVTSLSMMTLLALATFVAGVQTRVWQVCAVGGVLFLAVAAIVMPMPLSELSDVGDPHLRSLAAVTGYRIHASDGPMGHLDSFQFDDESWDIRYLVVDTKDWRFGRHVLLSPSAVREIVWEQHELRLNLTGYKIKGSPPWKATGLLDRAYKQWLAGYYDWPSINPRKENGVAPVTTNVSPAPVAVLS